MYAKYTTEQRFEVSAAWNKACGRPAVAEVFEIAFIEELPGLRFQMLHLKAPADNPRRFYGDATAQFMSCRGRFVPAGTKLGAVA